MDCLNEAPQNDKNTTYEDDQIIVFLATDPSSPKQTIKNCKFYGKGLGLCISESGAKTFCYKDRWIKKLTTYFVWLKKKHKFILIDSDPDGEYQYNNITIGKMAFGYDNKDYSATKEELLQLFPETSEAFQKNVFKYIPLQKPELEFYERINSVKSILELKNIQDCLEYACMPGKTITLEEWKALPKKTAHRVFKEYILSTATRSVETRDVSRDVLNLFPSLEYRYWTKVKNNTKISIVLGEKMSPHEYKVIRDNPAEFSSFISKDFFEENEILAGTLYRFFKKVFGKIFAKKILKIIKLDRAFLSKTQKVKQYLQNKLYARLKAQSLKDVCLSCIGFVIIVDSTIVSANIFK